MKKLWIFIGMIVLNFDIKSHIWLVFLSGKYRESEIPGKYGTGNLVLAIGIYTILTIISCVVLALPG